MLAARHAAMTAGAGHQEPLLGGQDAAHGHERPPAPPDPDAQAREMQRITSAAAKKTLLISAIIIGALFLAKWTIQFEIQGPVPDILQHPGYLRRYGKMRSYTSSPQAVAAALDGPIIHLSSSSSDSICSNTSTSSPSIASPAGSASTLSSPISDRRESPCRAALERSKEIIIIGGSLGKRAMIKAHLQKYFPDVHEVWISPHDIYRHGRTMSSPARPEKSNPGNLGLPTYAQQAQQQQPHAFVDYSGVFDCIEKDLIIRSVPRVYATQVITVVILVHCISRPSMLRIRNIIMAGIGALAYLMSVGSEPYTASGRSQVYSRYSGEAEVAPPIAYHFITADLYRSLPRILHFRSQSSDIIGIIPMLDAFVPFADRLCAALGLSHCGNSPLTSDHRNDKSLMQKCLARSGLRHCESRCFTTADAALAWRQPSRASPLVVKPVNSGGCDGVCVCITEEDVRGAFSENMYRTNAERLTNEKMVVQEFLGAVGLDPTPATLRRKRSKPGDVCEGEDSSSSCYGDPSSHNGKSSTACWEYIVNTVSLDGHHLTTDIWRGPPKAKIGCTECLYDTQECVSWSDCPPEVTDYAFKVLDATGVRNGAAHTELMHRIGDDVCLIEVNARVAGEVRGDLLRRSALPTDQLYWLLLSFIKPAEFLEAARTYRPEADFSITALFLQCHEEGPLSISLHNLYTITQRTQFCRFGRALSPLNQAAPFEDEERFVKAADAVPRMHNLWKTHDLISSPGVIIMRSEKTSSGRQELARLASRIRKSEQDGSL
ncbi:hypothetical protein FOL47_002599, partial [Perkinsus chesapeaki]